MSCLRHLVVADGFEEADLTALMARKKSFRDFWKGVVVMDRQARGECRKHGETQADYVDHPKSQIG